MEYFQPVRDGSIDIAWGEYEEYSILFNIPPGDSIPDFSGEVNGVHYAGSL